MYSVRIYYSSYCTYEIKSDNEENAILKARELEINRNELYTNLENWKESDDVEEIGNDKS